MRMLMKLAVAGSLMLLISACAAKPKTVEDVLADVSKKSAANASYTADMEMAMTMGPMAMKFGGPVQGKGKMMAMTTTMEMMNQKVAVKMVLDKAGIMWTDMDMMGMKQVMKMDMAQMVKKGEEMFPGMMPGGAGGMSGMQQDPRELAEAYNKMFTLEYSGTEQLEGTEVYALRGKVKDEVRKQFEGTSIPGMDFGAMMSEVRLKFGVADGFPRQVETLGADGVAWMTQTYKNVKVNAPVDDAVFTYTPPDGAQVMDMSEMMEAGMAGGLGAGAGQTGAGGAGDSPKVAPQP